MISKALSPLMLLLGIALLPLSSCQNAKEDLINGRFYITNATDSSLRVDAYRTGKRIDLAQSTLKAQSITQIYSSWELSSGHVFPSNFFQELYVIDKFDTLYQGVKDSDWVLQESTALQQKLRLTVRK